MSTGLSSSEREFLLKNVAEPIAKYGAEVFLFGSRANGLFHQFSDVDLLIKIDRPNNSLRQEVARIDELLTESSFPYKVDLVFDDDLADSYRLSVHKSLISL